jgi:hypothetical protein
MQFPFFLLNPGELPSRHLHLMLLLCGERQGCLRDYKYSYFYLQISPSIMSGETNTALWLIHVFLACGIWLQR